MAFKKRRLRDAVDDASLGSELSNATSSGHLRGEKVNKQHAAGSFDESFSKKVQRDFERGCHFAVLSCE